MTERIPPAAPSTNAGGALDHDTSLPAAMAIEDKPNMPTISRTTLGLVGLALGVGVGLIVFGASRRPQMTSRRRLERWARDILDDGSRAARRIEPPSALVSAFENDGRIGRLLRHWRD